jgi:hypothetical protein
LPNLLARTGHDSESLPALVDRIPAVVSWITWSEVGQVVAEQHASFEIRDESLTGTVNRLVGSLHDAIDTHTGKRSPARTL